MATGARRHQHRPLARLTGPLVRDDGVLRAATWDEALDRAARGFDCTLESLVSLNAFGPDRKSARGEQRS